MTTKKLHILAGSLIHILAFIILIKAGSASAALNSPFPIAIAPEETPKNEIFNCEKPPSSLQDLFFEAIFEAGDPTSSVVNPQQEARYNEAILPVRTFENRITQMANIYTRSQGRNMSSAACTLDWLATWASQKAMTGQANEEGTFIRRATLASAATSYLQIAFDKRLDAKKKVIVKSWIDNLAALVIDDSKMRNDTVSLRNRNIYWAGWAVGVSAVVLQKQKYFDWAMDKANIGLIQIQEDGTLPLEVRRGQRSLNSHLTATSALVMLAELGMANNTNLYIANNGALHRLVNLSATSLINPNYLEHRTGIKVKLSKEHTKSLLSWLEPYNARFGFSDPIINKKIQIIMKKNRPFFSRRAGGDVTLLYSKK